MIHTDREMEATLGRMQLEVREYLALHPREQVAAV